MQLVKEIVSNTIILKEETDLEAVKTKLNNFKKKPNPKLKKIIQESKIILTYDDRLDTYFVFANFLTQYGFYFKKTNNQIEVKFFPFQNTDENVYIYMLYLLYGLNIITEPISENESSPL